ncbi:MAG: hypothetical protein K6F33_11635 [Bacteroidales bacterium]|nr:hypothetical protein [Bacteroidales bacterium]
MQNPAKKRKKAITILLIYIIVSILFGLSAFKYLAPKFVSIHVIIGVFAIISIAVAMYILNYIQYYVSITGKSSSTFDSITEQDRKEKEQKELAKQEKELKRRKEEKDRQEIAEQIAEIDEQTKEETDTEKYFDQILIALSKSVHMVQGVAYTTNNAEEPTFAISGTYAYYTTDTSRTFTLGEGIPGQVAKDKRILCLDEVPEGYIKIVSGLGTSSPHYLIVAPIVHDGKTLAVLEMAMFDKPSFDINEFHKQFTAKVSEKISTLLQA